MRERRRGVWEGCPGRRWAGSDGRAADRLRRRWTAAAAQGAGEAGAAGGAGAGGAGPGGGAGAGDAGAGADAGGGTGPAGPARDLTSAANGPRPADAVTSDVSPTTAHRTMRVPCARATRSARAQAPVPPSAQWSAAASAARSAPPAARCRATTACPRASTTPNTTHITAIAPRLHTVAAPRSE